MSWRQWVHAPCPYCIIFGIQIGLLIIIVAIAIGEWWRQ